MIIPTRILQDAYEICSREPGKQYADTLVNVVAETAANWTPVAIADVRSGMRVVTAWSRDDSPLKSKKVAEIYRGNKLTGGSSKRNYHVRLDDQRNFECWDRGSFAPVMLKGGE